MIAERPDIEAYASYTNDLADVRYELARLEFELEKKVAMCLKEASQNGARVKELDFVKVVGNTNEDAVEIEKLHAAIRDCKKAIAILYGKIHVWEASKDIYRADSYSMVRGSDTYSPSSKESED